jgi:hypothetical protein
MDYEELKQKLSALALEIYELEEKIKLSSNKYSIYVSASIHFNGILIQAASLHNSKDQIVTWEDLLTISIPELVLIPNNLYEDIKRDQY